MPSAFPYTALTPDNHVACAAAYAVVKARFAVGDRVCIQNGGGETPGLEDYEGGEGTIIEIDFVATVQMDSGGTYTPCFLDMYQI